MVQYILNVLVKHLGVMWRIKLYRPQTKSIQTSEIDQFNSSILILDPRLGRIVPEKWTSVPTEYEVVGSQCRVVRFGLRKNLFFFAGNRSNLIELINELIPGNEHPCLLNTRLMGPSAGWCVLDYGKISFFFCRKSLNLSSLFHPVA
jgi:hypothetical protein